MGVVVKSLVCKRWVTKRHSIIDDRAVCLSLSRLGEVLARQIERRVRNVEATLTEHDGCALGRTSARLAPCQVCVTPTMEAKMADHVWTLEQITDLLDT